MTEKEFNLNEKREKIKEKVLSLFKADFIDPVKNAKQLDEDTDLIDFIIRVVKSQDKEFIKMLKERLENKRKEIKDLGDMLKPKGRDIPSKKPDILLTKLNLLQDIKRDIDKLAGDLE